jgi:hypothetical protein
MGGQAPLVAAQPGIGLGRVREHEGRQAARPKRGGLGAAVLEALGGSGLPLRGPAVRRGRPARLGDTRPADGCRGYFRAAHLRSRACDARQLTVPRAGT